MTKQGLLSGLPAPVSEVHPQTPGFQGVQEPLLAGLQGHSAPARGEEVRPSPLPAIVTSHVSPQHRREKKYFSLQTAYRKAVPAPAGVPGGDETHHCCFKGTKTKRTFTKLVHPKLLADIFPLPSRAVGLSSGAPMLGPGSPPYSKHKPPYICPQPLRVRLLPGGLGFTPAASILWSRCLQQALCKAAWARFWSSFCCSVFLQPGTYPLHRGLCAAGDAGSKQQVLPHTTRCTGMCLSSSPQKGWAMPLPSGQCAGALGTNLQQI